MLQRELLGCLDTSEVSDLIEPLRLAFTRAALQGVCAR